MKNKTLDRFDYHEVMDRTNMILSTFEDFVIKHPLVEMNQDLRDKAEEASTILGELYQMTGRKEFELEKKNKQPIL